MSWETGTFIFVAEACREYFSTVGDGGSADVGPGIVPAAVSYGAAKRSA